MSDVRTAQVEKRINPDIAGGIALYGSPTGSTTIAPKNLTDVMEFAKLMAVSGPCVRPAFRGNPGACLALALQAFRTGADPFAVANKAYITTSRAGDEQIAYEAQYIHAVMNNSGKLTRRLRASYSGEGQSRKCTITGYVADEEEPLEYESPTIGEIAVKNSPLWKGDPDQQLFYYSSRAWGRRHLPEVLLGMYTPDEIRGEVIDVSPAHERIPAPSRPRPEDFADQDDTAVESQSFQVFDFVGETHEYRTEVDAIDALWRLIGTAKSLLEADGLIENNPSLAAYPLIIEAYKDKKEALSNPGNRQDRPATGAPALDPARDVTPSADTTGQTKHPEGGSSSTPDKGRVQEMTAAEAATSVATKNTTDPRPRDEPKSFAVPLIKPVGKAADWHGTADKMVALIHELTDPDDLSPTGAFMSANRATINNMRDGNKDAWIKVVYELEERERTLRTGEK